MNVTKRVILSVFSVLVSTGAQANIPALAMVSTDVLIAKNTVALGSSKDANVKATAAEVSSMLERKLQAQLDASLEQRKEILEKK